MGQQAYELTLIFRSLLKAHLSIASQSLSMTHQERDRANGFQTGRPLGKSFSCWFCYSCYDCTTLDFFLIILMAICFLQENLTVCSLMLSSFRTMTVQQAQCIQGYLARKVQSTFYDRISLATSPFCYVGFHQSSICLGQLQTFSCLLFSYCRFSNQLYEFRMISTYRLCRVGS